MAKGKEKLPDINSSSTADIAFLLLIFFLITTSMDTDRGWQDFASTTEDERMRIPIKLKNVTSCRFI